MEAKTQLGIMAVAAAALLLLLEAGLRIGGARFDTVFHTADRELGWALRPSVSGWNVSEGRQLVQLNSHGFHDRERSIRKPEGVYRIAVLGNSWTEALQVPLEMTFCARLEAALQAAPPLRRRRVEVLNFGVSGYSTAQQLLQLRKRVVEYEPDLVLLAFYTARDILNNVRQFNNAAAPEQSPYFVWSDGRLLLDRSFERVAGPGRLSMLQRARFALGDRCRVYQAADHIVRAIKILAAKAALESRRQTSGVAQLDDSIYRSPASPEIENAWRVTEGLLSLMNQEARAHGAAFWIVSLANRPQVEPNREKRAAKLAALGVPDLDYADRRLQEFGKREGIPVTPLAPRMRAFAETRGVYLNGFANTAPGEGHWNETGHEAAAQAIGEAFYRLYPGGEPERVSQAHAPARAGGKYTR